MPTLHIRRKSAALALAAVLFGLTPAWAAEPAPQPTFLIVGTFHFAGSTADLMGNSFPDVLSEKRQKEVEAVVEALARFRPTKIAVEVPVTSTKIQERYQEYLDGKRALEANETDQIAMRLAKKLGHTRIWPADHKLDMDFDKVMQGVQQYGQQAFFDQAMGIGRRYVGETQRRLDQESLASVLRFMNDPAKLDEGHGAYMLMAQIGGPGDPKGAEVLADWYKRNLLIYANLVRLIESPQERVLLVIGAGHAKLIRDAIRQSPNLRLEETVNYLPQ